MLAVFGKGLGAPLWELGALQTFRPGSPMNPDMALHMMRDLFWTGLLVSAPILGFTMLVGLLISILQVVTQVQEMSLTFVPKLLVAGVCLILFGSWMMREIAQFSTRLWASIPSMF